MSLTDSVSLGPLSIPVILLLSILIAAAAFFAGSFFIKGGKTNRRIFSDLLFAPVLPFLLVWKLSLLITDARDVFINPGLLLYSSGGLLNILIGVTAGGLWLSYRWKKAKSPGNVNRAMIWAMGTALVLSLAVAGYTMLSGAEIKQKEKLPVVVFSDEKGVAWDISESAGSIVVLNFWASWCPPCRAEMPMLERLQSDPKFKNVVFYAVNASRTEKNSGDGSAWIESNGIELPLLFDDTGQGMNAYRITGLPTTIVTDSEGRVIERKTGAVSRSWLLSAIRKGK
ncbi:MAG: hypothetical protein DRP70_03845 [Spirochaetes bacterium]|nr:MAG: hypothetical protein DRP70_03845 [Spirochaetota bacterium]RKX98061.1 MAG: hypothetical protein DRZ90_04120 [Spirochaetota bacterium]